MNSAAVEAALIDLAVESWRFQKLFARALSRLDAGESLRFVNQHRYFAGRIEQCLAGVGLKLVNIEGQPFDPGIAATAINIADFSPNDELLIDQMIEPIVIGTSGLIRTGTVMLRKVEQ